MPAKTMVGLKFFDKDGSSTCLGDCSTGDSAVNVQVQALEGVISGIAFDDHRVFDYIKFLGDKACNLDPPSTA